MSTEEGFSSIYSEKKPSIFDRFKKSEPELGQQQQQVRQEPVQEQELDPGQREFDVFVANLRSGVLALQSIDAKLEKINRSLSVLDLKKRAFDTTGWIKKEQIDNLVAQAEEFGFQRAKIKYNSEEVE